MIISEYQKSQLIFCELDKLAREKGFNSWYRCKMEWFGEGKGNFVEKIIFGILTKINWQGKLE